jgi:peptidyl-prolyl cis-trans isomerase D
MQFFRKYFDSKLMKLIAIFIIMVFLSWDFLISTNKNTPNYLFKVGKIEYFMKDWQDNYRRMISDPLSAQEALQNPLYAKKRLFDDLVQKALILQEAERLGFIVSDKMVASEVVNLKIFKDKEGKFNSQLLTETLEKNQISEKDFIKNIKEKLVQNYLMDVFYNSGGILAKPLYNLLESLLAAETELLLYKIPEVKLEINPSEDQLRNYQKDNPADFTLPEKAEYLELKFTQANLDPDSLKISNEEVKNFYEERKEFEPEKRLFNQIVISDYKEALELKKALDQGKNTYDTIAKNYQDKALIPYEMGPITANSLDKDFAEELFNLKEGEVGKILESPIGWHLVRLVKIFPQEEKKFTQVKDKLLIRIKEEKISQGLQNLAQKILTREKVALKDLAQEYQITPVEKIIEMIPDEEDYDGFSRQKILQNIFQGEKEGLKLISSKDNKSFVLLEVIKIHPKRLEDFTFDKVKEAYLKKERDKATKDLASNFKKALLEKKPLPFEIKPEKLIFSRLQSNLPEVIERKIFQLNEMGIFTGIVGPEKSDKDYLLAALGKMNFNSNLNPQQKEQLRTLIQSLYQEIIFKNYLESLTKIYPTEVNSQFQDYLKSSD